MNGGRLSLLHVLPVEENSGGNYTCVASRGTWSMSSSARVNVVDSPKITSLPQTVSAKIG